MSIVGRTHRGRRLEHRRTRTTGSIDARGGYVLPGFIQTHIHLCQTLFRGFADDLPLMDWLRTRVWPMEAAHTPATLRAATRLATTELLASGTTAVLTMETVHDTDVVFEAVAESGLRATIGKCMMDFDAQVPQRLQEETRALASTRASRSASGGTAPSDGRLHAAFAPRFAVSCSRELLEAVASSFGAASGARSHARVGVARRDRHRHGDVPVRLYQHRVSRRRCTSRRLICAPRIASGWTTPISSCWPSTTSR